MFNVCYALEHLPRTEVLFPATSCNDQASCLLFLDDWADTYRIPLADALFNLESQCVEKCNKVDSPHF